MKKILVVYMALLCLTTAYTQQTLRLMIESEQERKPLAGATVTVAAMRKTAVADMEMSFIDEPGRDQDDDHTDDLGGNNLFAGYEAA